MGLKSASLFFSLAVLLFANQSMAEKVTISCNDNSGKTRVSFHVDSSQGRSFPQGLTVKFDGEIIEKWNVGRFDDDGPTIGGKTEKNIAYSAKLNTSQLAPYESPAEIDGVATTLQCSPQVEEVFSGN